MPSLDLLVGTNAFTGVPTNAIFRVSYSSDSGFSKASLSKFTGSYGSPGWLCAVAGTTTNDDGTSSGAVALVADESKAGRIYELPLPGQDLSNEASTGGANACHVSASSSAGIRIACNYKGGSVAVFNAENQRTQLISHQDLYDGVDRASTPLGFEDRQEGPHPHHSLFLGERHVLVSDLGVGAVVVYEHSSSSSSSPDDGGASSSPVLKRRSVFTPTAGWTGGCRHTSSFGGDDVYIMNELVSSVTHAKFDAASGTLEEVATTALAADVPEGTRTAHGGGGGIAVAGDGSRVFVTLRHTKPGRLVVLDRDAASGALTVKLNTSSGGDTPRFVASIGEEVFVANQDSSKVSVFDIEGKLKWEQEFDEKVTCVCPL